MTGAQAGLATRPLNPPAMYLADGEPNEPRLATAMAGFIFMWSAETQD